MLCKQVLTTQTHSQYKCVALLCELSSNSKIQYPIQTHPIWAAQTIYGGTCFDCQAHIKITRLRYRNASPTINPLSTKWTAKAFSFEIELCSAFFFFSFFNKHETNLSISCSWKGEVTWSSGWHSWDWNADSFGDWEYCISNRTSTPLPSWNNGRRKKL